jgi:chaperonin GroES
MATATATPTQTKKKVKFRPTEDRVLVEPLEATERTTGGIILPDTAKEKPQRGKVLAVGPGKTLKDGKRGEMNLSVGDEVVYGKYSGTEVDFGTDTYVVIRENDVLAVVEK